jgi:chemotaxis protein methyltransferase CheR
MNNRDCVGFLQWALPRLGLHWPGFRKVRQIVCKRIERRRRALGIANLDAYREYLDDHGQEWEALRALCSIPISRFGRDRSVFELLEHSVLPALAAAAGARLGRTLTCWSAGCASGEEPYSVSILWGLHLAQFFPGVTLRVLATDIDDQLLERAAIGCYGWSSLKETPRAWSEQAFERRGGAYCVREAFRESVTFARQDIRLSVPDTRFDLILCRNVVLTYFEPEVRHAVMRRVADALRPGGALVVGVHETLPQGMDELVAWPEARAVFRRIDDGSATVSSLEHGAESPLA